MSHSDKKLGACRGRMRLERAKTSVSTPSALADEASSRPRNPAPITARRVPDLRQFFNLTASSQLRKACTLGEGSNPPKKRGVEPVAIRHLSNDISSPFAKVATLAAASNDTTLLLGLNWMCSF